MKRMEKLRREHIELKAADKREGRELNVNEEMNDFSEFELESNGTTWDLEGI